MILFEELKKLRALPADPGYTKRSRDLILAHTPHEHPSRVKATAVFLQALRFGSASLATGALMIALIWVGVTASRMFTTPEFGGLDRATLKAEADQIDIQIQLTALGEYKEEALLYTESTVPRTKIAPKGNPKEIPTTSPSSTPLTLDEALELLAK